MNDDGSVTVTATVTYRAFNGHGVDESEFRKKLVWRVSETLTTHPTLCFPIEGVAISIDGDGPELFQGDRELHPTMANLLRAAGLDPDDVSDATGEAVLNAGDAWEKAGRPWSIDESSQPKPSLTEAERIAWTQLRESKLLWWINRSLHLFGWAIVYLFESAEPDARLMAVYPDKVSCRGFSREAEEEGFEGLTRYLADEGAALLEAVNDE